MTTPTQPAPGSPAWLRRFAGTDESSIESPELRADRAGLRAAAERIEELERVQRVLKAEVAAANRGARTNALVNESLLASEKNYIRKCAELSDEVQRLRAENEALKQDKERKAFFESGKYERAIILDHIRAVVAEMRARVKYEAECGYYSEADILEHFANKLEGIERNSEQNCTSRTENEELKLEKKRLDWLIQNGAKFIGDWNGMTTEWYVDRNLIDAELKKEQ